VSGENQRAAKYRLTFALDIPADLVAMQEVDPAARQAVVNSGA
jgi:hypothetical protein